MGKDGRWDPLRAIGLAEKINFFYVVSTWSPWNSPENSSQIERFPVSYQSVLFFFGLSKLLKNLLFRTRCVFLSLVCFALSDFQTGTSHIIYLILFELFVYTYLVHIYIYWLYIHIWIYPYMHVDIHIYIYMIYWWIFTIRISMNVFVFCMIWHMLFIEIWYSIYGHNGHILYHTQKTTLHPSKKTSTDCNIPRTLE